MRTKALFIALAIASVCFAKDIKTVVLTTNPQMHCENCEKKIKDNIRFENAHSFSILHPLASRHQNRSGQQDRYYRVRCREDQR